MKIFKLILVAIGIVLVAMLAFSVVGIVYSALWYLFWIGVAALAGFTGYKFLQKADTGKLEEKTPTAISEMQNTDRTLEEYKRKYQLK